MHDAPSDPAAPLETSQDPAGLGPPDLPGVTLGRLVGAGGMGRVYAGRSAQGREIAVKVFAPGVRSDAEMLARLRREVEALTAARHPGLVTLLGYDLDGPTPYLVMPLYPGGDLSDRRKLGPMPTDRVRQVAARLGGALAALARAGFVHRDVKPGNVFLDEHGQPVLGDMGLARGEGHATLTGQGKAVGTFAFMAPEVLRGERATPAADVFALGLTLLAISGGRKPVVSAQGVIFPRGDLAKTLDPGLEALVRTMLAPNARLRPPAEEVARLALEWTGGEGDLRLAESTRAVAMDGPTQALRTSRVEVGAKPRAARRLGPWLAVAAVLAGGLGVAARRMGGGPATPAPAASPAPAEAQVGLDVATHQVLARLGPALAADLAAVQRGERGPSTRTGLAALEAWCQAGQDPARLPRLVRRQLRDHDQQRVAAGAARAFGPAWYDGPAPGAP